MVSERAREPVVATAGSAGPTMDQTRLSGRVQTLSSAPPLVAPGTGLLPRPPDARDKRPARSEREEPDTDTELDTPSGLDAAGGAAPVGARVQRSSLPELVAAVTRREPAEGGLLVDDEARNLTAGQERKSDFLRELRAEVNRVADAELRRVGRTAADCPYISALLDRYQGRSAAEVERSLRRYAPAARAARDARAYVTAVGERVTSSVRRWIETGQLPDDLPEAGAGLGAASGWVGAIAGLAGLGSAPRDSPSSGPASGGPTPQRKALGPSPGRVDGAALVEQLGPGRPLDGTTRARMEGGFGQSFAAVRLHADDPAAELSRSLAAQAFTVGPHIALGAGAPRPGSPEGDALLAHELAHVVQQGTAAPRGELPIGEADDPLERDADRAAADVVVALHAPSKPPRRPTVGRARGGLRLQRCAATYQQRSHDDLLRAIPMIATAERRHGVSIIEESANWSPDEIAALDEALGLIDQRERDQIGAGLTFARVASTGATGGGLDAQALATRGAARQNGVPFRSKRIAVGNEASSLRHSELVRVLVHELGHLIESARADQTALELMQSADAIDPARTAVDASRGAFGPIWNATAAAGGATSRYTPAESRSFSPFFTAIEGAVNRYLDLHRLANNPTIADVIRDQPAIDAALTSAIADRDRELAALRASAPGHPALTDFPPVITAMDAALADLRRYLAARIANERASQAHSASVVGPGASDRTRRLEAFRAVVDAEGIGPLRVPGGPRDPAENYTGLVLRRDGRDAFIREMFAEAFSLWRTARSDLQDQAPALVRFFDRGEHLR